MHKNHRVQSKILDGSFPMEFRFETKLGSFFIRQCISQLTLATELSSVIFVIYFCDKHDALEGI